jgi:hypothetical protein
MRDPAACAYLPDPSGGAHEEASSVMFPRGSARPLGERKAMLENAQSTGLVKVVDLLIEPACVSEGRESDDPKFS